MADVADLVVNSGVGESWKQSHYVVKQEATRIREEDKTMVNACSGFDS